MEDYLEILCQKIYIVCLFQRKEKSANAHATLNGQRYITQQNKMEIPLRALLCTMQEKCFMCSPMFISSNCALQR